VSVSVSDQPHLTAGPGTLLFTDAPGQSPSPQQTVQVASSGAAIPFAVSSSVGYCPLSGTMGGLCNPTCDASWLDVSTTATTTPATLTVSVTPSFAHSSSCFGSIELNDGNNSSLTIPVTYYVSGSAPLLNVNMPPGFELVNAAQGTAQLTQSFSLTSETAGLEVNISSVSGPNAWLSVIWGPSGTTPQQPTAVINPQGLAPGTYAGLIEVTAPPQTFVIPVSLTVTPANAPSTAAVLNSANAAGLGAIAPGELIAIRGTGLGPSTPVSFTTAASHTIEPTLGGVQVLFDSTPGTVLYASPTQINVIAPWELAGRAQTAIAVTYSSATSIPFNAAVASASPALYTLDSTGSGQAAALNGDYSINGPASGVLVNGTLIASEPAVPGSEIAIYGTGAGGTVPAGVDGTVTPPTPLYPLANASRATATIGGQPANVLFIGTAPDEVTGVFQVNLKVPSGLSGDALPVAITIQGVTTLTGPTIAVQ